MTNVLEVQFSDTRIRLNSGREFVVTGAFHVAAGEVALLLGENGAGKTTILALVHSVLAGREAGHILWLDWGSVEVRPSGVSVTVVFQEPRENFICRSSADELVLPLLDSRLHAEDAIDRIEKLVDALDIHRTDLFERKIDHLSSGEQQKFAIAAALSSGPDVMLWDEALARIDDPAAERISELLRGVQKDTALVAATHRPERYNRLFRGRVTSHLTVRRSGVLLSLTQSPPGGDDADLYKADQPLNFVGRALWKAYAGQQPIDPAVRLFSNGFRVFGSGSVPVFSLSDLEVFADRTRIASCRAASFSAGVNFVVGRNGSGKTTLLQTLAGQIPLNPMFLPIIVRKRTHAVATPRLSEIGPLGGLRRRGLSTFLPAEPFRWLTDESVDSEMLRYHDGGAFERRAGVLAGVGIQLDANPEHLSYGQRKLVALLSLPDNLELVCLDEPFADLGTRYVELAEDFILEQCRSQRWHVVAVSHSSDVDIASA